MKSSFTSLDVLIIVSDRSKTNGAVRLLKDWEARREGLKYDGDWYFRVSAVHAIWESRDHPDRRISTLGVQ
jgi:hypothetical protein